MAKRNLTEVKRNWAASYEKDLARFAPSAKKSRINSLPVTGVRSLRTLVWYRETRANRPVSWIQTSPKAKLLRSLAEFSPEMPEATPTPTPTPKPTPAPVKTEPAKEKPMTEAEVHNKPTATERIGAAVLGALDETIREIEAKVDDLAKNPAGLDEAKVKALVEKLVADTPIIKIQRADGEVAEVKGAHNVMPLLAKQVHAENSPWIVGPSGSFKTSGVRQLAKAMGFELFIQPPACFNHEILGHKDANGNVHDTQFSAFMRYRGDAILLCDEVDAWHEPAQMAANLALDNCFAVLPDGKVNITEDGKYRKVFIATANTYGFGGNENYVGRRLMDGAFRNRFNVTLYWGYDEKLERKIADNEALKRGADEEMLENVRDLVIKIQASRAEAARRKIKAIIGPRQTFAAVRALVAGISLDDIWETTILGTINDKTVRQSLRK